MTIFLVDTLVAMFPSLVSVIIFCIGMAVTKDKKRRGEWWTAGLILFVLYAFGNLTSEYRDYYSIVIGAVVIPVFRFIMLGKKQKATPPTRKDPAVIFAIICAVLAVTGIVIGSYHALT